MIVETVSPVPSEAEGVHAFEPDSPINEENLIDSQHEPEATPEEDRPPGGSKSNAFKHGLSGSGAVMTARDQAECDRLFQNLCDTYEPETPYEEDLLRIVARERTLLGRCQ